ncbi:MAG TPA: hypothetical protein DCE43_12000 [Planctomycetaceae bacterium]|nr:hypothetical protein [Planctomycetaceae bacterium]
MLVGMANSSTERTGGERGSHSWKPALLELGRDLQLLRSAVHYQFLQADMDTPLAPNHFATVSRCRSHIATLLALFHGSPAELAFERLRRSLESAWRKFRGFWLGEDHVTIISCRMESEIDLIPDDWWSQNSPLNTSLWRRLHGAAGRLEKQLDEYQATLFEVGSLIAQASHLSDCSPLQNEILGEADPTARLQTALIRLRSHLGSPAELDVELPRTGSIADSFQLFQGKLQSIDRQLYHLLMVDDGPAEPQHFCWREERLAVRGRMPWKLISYLWQQEGRSATFEDLAHHVWEEPFENVGDDTVGSARRNANGFFRDHGIPLLVRTSHSVAMLVDH